MQRISVPEMQPFEQEGMDAVRRAGVEITTEVWLAAYDDIRTQVQTDFAAQLQREAKEQGVDRCDEAGDVRLTETEVRDIRALNSAFEDFVIVLNVGGVVDLAPVAEVATVLLMSQLGSAAEDAVADVLLGTSYPSGKLTTTWAAVTDDPSTEGFGGRACTGGQRCHNAGQCARFAGDSCRRRQSDAYVSADACRFAKVGDAPPRTGVGPCAYEAIRDLRNR